MTSYPLPQSQSRETVMKTLLYSLLLTAGLTFGLGTTAQAVVPVVQLTNDVEWSKVMNDPFDGAVVYDKNFDPGGSFEFISRWSSQGIQATYRNYYTHIVGYQSFWGAPLLRTRQGFYRAFAYPDHEPVYRRFGIEKTPVAIKFAINGQVYTYEKGTVSPELATALATAPDQNMIIRLLWEDGGATDVAIGRNTVAAWKTIFRPTSTPAKPVQ